MRTLTKILKSSAARLIVLSMGLLVVLSMGSCRSTVASRNPKGEPFPAVGGKSLEDKSVELPPRGEPAVLLIGYDQDAQFDADRWLYGLLQSQLPVRVVEVPTIPGLFPRLIAGSIDSGMRSGIPSEDWGAVVTLYGAAAGTLVDFTGNEQPNNMRVLLLDRDGNVRWFHDRGFSAGKLIELEHAARTLLDGG